MSRTPHPQPVAYPAARPAVDLEVVVPALDEEARLPATLGRTVDYLAAQPYTSAVVVVDNGSVDGTADIVARFRGGRVPVHLLGCARCGKGSAVRRGITTGRSRFVGFMDADLATPIETLGQVVPLLEDGVPAVIASRYDRAAKIAVRQGILRRLGGHAFRLAAKTVLPGLRDSQCGFKFFVGPVAREVVRRCRIDGFTFDVELLAQLVRLGHEVVEVPVVWRDVAGSTFRPLRHGPRSLYDTLRVHLLLAGS